MEWRPHTCQSFFSHILFSFRFLTRYHTFEEILFLPSFLHSFSYLLNVRELLPASLKQKYGNAHELDLGKGSIIRQQEFKNLVMSYTGCGSHYPSETDYHACLPGEIMGSRWFWKSNTAHVTLMFIKLATKVIE